MPAPVLAYGVVWPLVGLLGLNCLPFAASSELPNTQHPV